VTPGWRRHDDAVGTDVSDLPSRDDPELRDASRVARHDHHVDDRVADAFIADGDAEHAWLFAGEDVDRSSLFETVKRLLLPVGALAILSITVNVIVRNALLPSGTPVPTDTGVSFDSTGIGTDPVPSLGELTGIGVSPGAIFFVGGLLALFLVTFVYRDRQPLWRYRRA
jgi:hypothetical protein